MTLLSHMRLCECMCVCVCVCVTHRGVLEGVARVAMATPVGTQNIKKERKRKKKRERKREKKKKKGQCFFHCFNSNIY